MIRLSEREEAFIDLIVRAYSTDYYMDEWHKAIKEINILTGELEAFKKRVIELEEQTRNLANSTMAVEVRTDIQIKEA